MIIHRVKDFSLIFAVWVLNKVDISVISFILFFVRFKENSFNGNPVIDVESLKFLSK